MTTWLLADITSTHRSIRAQVQSHVRAHFSLTALAVLILKARGTHGPCVPCAGSSRTAAFARNAQPDSHHQGTETYVIGAGVTHRRRVWTLWCRRWHERKTKENKWEEHPRIKATTDRGL